MKGGVIGIIAALVGGIALLAGRRSLPGIGSSGSGGGGGSGSSGQRWRSVYSYLDPNDEAGRDQFVSLIRAQLGKPYLLGADGPNAFDCASLVQWAYRQMNITVADCVSEQVWQAPYVAHVNGSKGAALTILKKGDCIAMDHDDLSDRYDHVGVWTGSPTNTVIHASGGAACPNHPTSRCKVVEDSPDHWGGE